MWHIRTSIIPVGALRLIGKDFNRLIEGIPGSPCLKEIQKKMYSQVHHTHYEEIYLCKMYVIFFFK